MLAICLPPTLCLLRGESFSPVHGLGLPASMRVNLTWLGHELPGRLVKHSGDVYEGVFQ